MRVIGPAVVISLPNTVPGGAGYGSRGVDGIAFPGGEPVEVPGLDR
jgi:hypothetical protein